MKKKSAGILILGLLPALFLAGCTSTAQSTGNVVGGTTATVYKSPTCGCCVNYIAGLRKRGYSVEVKEMEDLSSIKKKYHIPHNMQSCHTTVIGDYFIEGHVPWNAVEKMLDEKPAIDGISLPGMPPGSPGMPGVKRGPFTIYGISKGSISEYAKK